MTPADICRQVFDAGMTIHADGHDLVLTPAERLKPAMRALLVENKPALLAYLREVEDMTAGLLAAAMRSSDHHGDSHAARDDWKRDIADTPPHLRSDLLAHLRQAHPGRGA
ncbi:hypothetical protein [Pseudorhodoferax soli]|uniref:TubC N-terminal docking domain-containing protein n=1 Tax=Pseudorhodoferax soli TaxID=545864 RepID=A0A368XB31_9BURK|nr:hypothetical protein [Pseudorhodoferax soli]RCW65172.1 hypothetical protein DES41_11396 [Pseudorhodoferax soli]